MTTTLSAEEQTFLPRVALRLREGRPADMDDTRRLLDIIDRLDRATRAASEVERLREAATEAVAALRKRGGYGYIDALRLLEAALGDPR